MKATIHGNPDFGHLTVDLEPNEHLLCESGAMAYMDPGMELNSKLMGGCWQAFIRKIFAGESLLVGDYHHPRGGSITISPAIPGSVLQRKIKPGETFFMQGGAFMAGSPSLELGTAFGGCRALFSGEGAFFLTVQGSGELFFNAYGGVVEKEVDGEYVVDTGHLVAWEDTLEWTIGKMGSLKTAFLSGEGLVMNFKGHGRIWLQSRTMGGLAGWLSGYCY